MLVSYLQVVQNVNIRHWPNLLMFIMVWWSIKTSLEKGARKNQKKNKGVRDLSGKYTGIIVNEKMKHDIKSLNINIYIPVFLTTIKFPGTFRKFLDFHYIEKSLNYSQIMDC